MKRLVLAGGGCFFLGIPLFFYSDKRTKLSLSVPPVFVD